VRGIKGSNFDVSQGSSPLLV